MLANLSSPWWGGIAMHQPSQRLALHAMGAVCVVWLRLVRWGCGYRGGALVYVGRCFGVILINVISVACW